MVVASFFFFGLIIGSFLNVLILRWGKQTLGGRSACVSCGTTLAWHDLIPILSWAILLGRCRYCGARISSQYVLVELTTALLFLIVGCAPLPLFIRIFSLPIVAILIAIAVHDFRTTLMPNAWVYAFCALSLFTILFFPPQNLSDALAALIAGPLVALPLFALWYISDGAWMGFGDVKFALGMGWLLGLGDGIIALFFAFVIGALVSVPLLFFSSPGWKRVRTSFTPSSRSQNHSRSYTMKSEIPFGPFLVASTLIVWLSTIYGFVPLELLV